MMEAGIGQYLITVQRNAQHTYDVRVEAPTAFDATAKYKQHNPSAKILAVRLVNRK
jgi:hypothetical protein